MSFQDSNCNSIFQVYLAILRKTVIGITEYFETDPIEGMDSNEVTIENMISADTGDIHPCSSVQVFKTNI